MIKLYNDDMLNVLKNINDNSIDLVITDPPYLTTKRGGTGNSGGMCKKKEFSSGKGGFKHNNIKPEEFIPELFRVLKYGTHCYIMSNHVNLQKMINIATDSGFHFIKCLIWDKGNKIMGQCYMNQFEYILFFRKGEHKKINNCGTSDLLSIPNKKTKVELKDNKGNVILDKNERPKMVNLHDTEKPVELMEILINNSSNENEIVLDPFMGIGGTGVGCLNTNRRFIGVEIDENYFDIAKDRLEKYKLNCIK